jgi:hypothetical protein
MFKNIEVEKLRWKSFSLMLIVTLALLTSLALADTKVTTTPVVNHIKTNELASFKVTVENTGDVEQNYKIYSLEIGWMIDPSPEDRVFVLNPGESRTTTVIIKPMEEFKPGAYAPTLYIDEYIDNKYKPNPQQLIVYLSPEGPVNYMPSLKVDVDVQDKINPKDSVPIKIFIENKNPLNLEGLTVRIQSDIPEFVKEATIDLPPLEKKTVEFSIIPSEFQQPKEYTLFFVIGRDGQDIKLVEKKIEILSLLPDFVTSLDTETVFFKSFSTLNVENTGNVKNTQEVKVPISSIQSLFVKSDAIIKVKDGQRYLTWETTLGSDEITSYLFYFNYRVLFYLVVVFILFGGFYFYVSSPVSVVKSAQTTHSDEEGALSEIKIKLEISNKSNHILKHVNITDIVPGIANVEKSLELGTLKPKEVRHLRKGTKVVWSLAELEPKEHRIITYKIKAKLNIVGTFSLPRAILEYSKKKGKVGKAYSNVFNLNS